MLKAYPKFKRLEIEKIYSKLPTSEKKLFEDYIFFRKARGTGEEKAKDVRRYLIQVRHVIECNFKDFKELEQHARLVVLIKNSYLSDNVKQGIFIDLNNLFGEYLFPDWWGSKFKSLYSSKNNKHNEGKKKIPTDEEIEKMIKSEKSIFWKTFLLHDVGSGNRQKETRTAENSKITFNPDGTSTIEIFMTKNNKTKFNFLDKQTTDYIKKLQDEQKNTGNFGKYLYPSPRDINRPISKNAVNTWFRELSLKATGKHYTPHALRHWKATKMYNLAKNNKISEYTALRLMGHAKSMMNTYDHTPKDEEIAILKAQAFNTEISPERKHELEERIEELENRLQKIEEERNIEIEMLKKLVKK